MRLIVILGIIVLVLAASVTAELYLDDFVVSSDEKITTFKGYLYDMNKVPKRDITVEAHCLTGNTELEGEGVTDNIGFFEVNISNLIDGCEEGDEAWVIVEDEGYKFRSNEIAIVRSDPIVKSDQKVDDVEGVPEYSTISLAFTVIVGCLGIAFIRKQ